VQAVKGVSLEVLEGVITGLIGANGTGKSTTLKAISGLVPLTSGEIWFEGRRIDGRSPEKIFALGIVHVPEGKRLFLEMSVMDNLLAGAYLRKDTESLGSDLERIYDYFPVLKKAQHRPASNLSGGEQQMLAIGRGLMAHPRLLLLDEPSLGLSPLLTREVGAITKRIAEEEVPILLVEQNASLAFQLAQKIYVMETGNVVLEGDPLELKNNPHVREAYLGISPAADMPHGGVVYAEAKRAGAPDIVLEERWQDKGPRGRWQDKGPQAKWQDSILEEREAPPKRSQPEMTQGKQLQEIKTQKARAVERLVGERRSEVKEMSERWPEERLRAEKWRKENELPERWPKEKRQHKREAPEKWSQEGPTLERWSRARERGAVERRPEGGELPERWPGERRSEKSSIPRKEPPSRVVKKSFVPLVRNAK
jgi:branched-chain amino acid transport system ATP-binding protein